MPLIRRIAEEVLGPGERARSVWKRADLIGDIMILKKPPGVSAGEMRLIAERILERLPYVKSVWMAAGPVGGAHRVRERLVHLAGERRTVTVYKEHGCRFKVDIMRVFITPRLSFEHLRVARAVRPWETVLNMFAGAGLFSIMAACKSSPRRVYSVDINPHAYELMVENVRLNRVEHIVEPILGDAAEVARSLLRGVADRVLLPLPELALEYLPHALLALRSCGTLHVYLHIGYDKGEDPRVLAERAVEDALERYGARCLRIIGSRVVRPVGPRTDQVVVDVQAG